MSYHAKVAANGTVELPADLLREAGIRAGDAVVIDRDGDGNLVIKTRNQIVRDAQAYFRSLVPAGVSLVDELIADRRAEAAREDAENEEWHRPRSAG